MRIEMRIGTSVVAVATGALLAAMSMPAAAQGNAFVLKSITGWNKSLVFNDMYMEWAKRVNERTKGQVRIDYLGGPEVYPSFEQLEPLRRNVVQVMLTSTAYVAGALPEVNATWFGFGATPEQLRESGLVDALDKVTREKAGVTVLGLPLQMRFNVYLNKPIQKIDLTGLKMRTTPVYEPILKGLGASTVTVQPAELLTALETGIVDGFAWPGVAVVAPGYARAVKFKTNPPWWVGTDIALMNAKVFDALSDANRKIMIDTMREIERETPAYYQKKEQEENVALAKLGVKDIETSPAEMARLAKMHFDAGTKTFLLDRSPKYGPQLRDIVSRFVPK